MPIATESLSLSFLALLELKTPRNLHLLPRAGSGLQTSTSPSLNVNLSLSSTFGPKLSSISAPAPAPAPFQLLGSEGTRIFGHSILLKGPGLWLFFLWVHLSTDFTLSFTSTTAMTANKRFLGHP